MTANPRRIRSRRPPTSSTGPYAGPASGSAQSVVDVLMDPYVLLTPVVNLDGTIVDFVVAEANEPARRSAVAVRERVVGGRLTDVLPRKTSMVQLLAGVARTGRPLSIDDIPFPGFTPHDPERRYSLRAMGDRRGVRVTWRDVTDAHSTAHELRNLRRLYRALADDSGAVVVRTDEHGVVVAVSPSGTDLLGWSPAEVLGQSWSDFVHGEDQPPEQVTSDESGESRMPGPFQARYRTAQGGYRYLSATTHGPEAEGECPSGEIIVIRNAPGAAVVSHLGETREQLAYLASHDSLTQVANRREFLLLTTRALERLPLDDARLAVLFVDVDGLKAVNDTLGHAAGDQLLIAVAERMTERVRHTDVVARLGGDEFLVLLPAIDSAAAAEGVASKIQDGFAVPVSIDGQCVRVTVGIGIAIAEPGQPPEAIIRHADAALYRAKHSGAGRTAVFDPAVDDVTVADVVRTSIAGSAARSLAAGFVTGAQKEKT